jgi:CBS-domain-containing membrane protein
MTGRIPTVSNRRCLDEAFRLLQEKSVPAVGIIDAAERLVGLATSETVGEMLMLHHAMPRGVRIGPWGSSGRRTAEG